MSVGDILIASTMVGRPIYYKWHHSLDTESWTVKWSKVSSKHVLITVPNYGCDVTRFLVLLSL